MEEAFSGVAHKRQNELEKASTLLSIVVPARDRPQFLGAALLPLRKLAFPWEAVVIDDGSTPPLRPPPELPTSFPLRWLRLDRTLGPAAARNHGAEAARGEWLYFLDSDDIPCPDGLNALVGLANSQPLVERWRGSLAGFVDHFGGRIQPQGFEGWTRAQPVSRQTLQEGGVPIGLPLLLLRREYFFRLGALDGSLRIGEDLDFLFRVLKDGPLEAQPMPLFFYRLHAENLTWEGGPSPRLKSVVAAASTLIRRHYQRPCGT